MEYRYFSLRGATMAPRTHEKEKSLPAVTRIRNMFPSRSDAVPSLRHDLTYETEHLEGWTAKSWRGMASGTTDFPVAIFRGRPEGDKIYLSKYIPYTTTGGTATVKVNTYSAGTLSGTSGTSVLTGSGTSWLRNLWEGCFLYVNSATWFRVSSVDSDTQVTVEGTLPATYGGGTTYVGYQTHQGDFGTWLPNVEWFGNNIIYQFENLDTTPDPDKIVGPFKSAAAGGYLTWADTKVATGGDLSFGIAYDGSGIIMVCKTEAGGFDAIYSTDGGATWAVVETTSAVVTPTAISYANGYFYVIDASAAATRSSDGGATWVDVTAFTGGDAGVVYGNGLYVSVDTAHTLYSLDGDTFTDSGYTPLLCSALVWTGSRFVAPGIGTVYLSVDGKSWTVQALPDPYATGIGTATTYCLYWSGAYLYCFAQHSSGSYRLYRGNDYGQAWSSFELPDGVDVWNGIVADPDSGKLYIVGVDSTPNPDVSYLYSSIDNGETWELEATLSNPTAATWSDMNRVVKFSNNILAPSATAGSVVKITSTSSARTTTVPNFRPVSTTYRATTFACIDAYTVFGGMLEWKDGGYEYIPRRFRWPSPGTLEDWTGEGSGFLDAPGLGSILAMRPVGHNVVVWESDRISVLEQIGDFDVAFGYRMLKEGIRLASNPVILEGQRIYFVASDGLLYLTDGSQVQQAGGFDLTAFTDYDASSTSPIHLAYFPTYGSIAVFRPTASGVQTVYLVSESTGSVSELEIPSLYDSTTERPLKSVFVSQTPDDPRLYLGYAPLAADTDHTVACYLNVGSAIRGVDNLTATQSYHWYAYIETGEERLTKEGQRASTHDITLRTYSGNTVTPDVAVEVRSHGDTSWRSAGTTTGTITLTTSACTGSGTAFSNLIAAGDDATSVFTVPCLAATQARVYTKTGSTYTAGTYTVTGTKQITLSSALATGTDLYVYWDAEPIVKVSASDYIASSDRLTTTTLTEADMHYISTVTDATHLALGHYLSTGTATGYHVPANNMTAGRDASTTLACPAMVDGFKLRIFVIPRNDGTSSILAEVSGYTVGYTPVGAEVEGD